MIYQFSSNTLQTKGAYHTALAGKQEITLEFPRLRATHYFTVVRRFKQAEDSEGACYDWYRIKDHTVTVFDDPEAVAELESDLEQAYELLYGGEDA